MSLAHAVLAVMAFVPNFEELMMQHRSFESLDRLRRQHYAIESVNRTHIDPKTVCPKAYRFADGQLYDCAGLSETFHCDDGALCSCADLERLGFQCAGCACDDADSSKDAAAANAVCFETTVGPQTRVVKPFTEFEEQRALIVPFGGYSTALGTSSSSLLNMMAVAANMGIEAWIASYVGSINTNQLLATLEASFGLRADARPLIKPLPMPLDSPWMVDYGPFPIKTSPKEGDPERLEVAAMRYYSGRPQDDKYPNRLSRSLPTYGLSPTVAYQTDLSAEGGKYQALSDGTCITTTRWSSTNVGSQHDLTTLAGLQSTYDPVGMRSWMTSHLGCTSIVFLYDIIGDGTGHVDMFFKAASDTHMIVGYYDLNNYPGAVSYDQDNKQRMDSNAQLLESLGYNVSRVIMPGTYLTTTPPVYGNPFTFVNSVLLVKNGVKKNLVPVSYVVPNDIYQKGLQEWRDALPDWEHVPIDATSLSYGAGALHCVTRNWPDVPTELRVADGTCDSGTCVPTDDLGYDGPCYTYSCVYTNDECFGTANSLPSCEAATGDLDGDGAVNVIDVVSLVGCILNNGVCAGGYCMTNVRSDVTGDGAVDVLDVVSVVQIIL